VTLNDRGRNRDVPKQAKRRGELTWIGLEAFLAEASEERQAFLTEGEDLGTEVVDLRFELHEREMVRRSGSAGALGRRVLAGGGGRRVLPLGDRGVGHGCCCDEGEHQRGARASLERWRAAPESRRRAILKEPGQASNVPFGQYPPGYQ
jgi:hypothetical protein